MSGHSAWANIKHKKMANDAKKGKIFSKIAKEIMIAVRIGGKDPSSNITLRTLLQNSPEFVWLAGKWFPRSLLMQINEGQLNIAEAILDMNGGGPLLEITTGDGSIHVGKL